ncbi:NAD(P)/FAD-dependent oxidoreductase [Dyadobacter sp. CY312]|uniref:NAD(P)/FAD-dependent oxidoreductase n=1 Tax=Dyadobacter sp. CY312 TaxID=2907303 RepID=UPI001F2F9BCF|nr:NAD(P)/FAD-dependent oxidoreductase [Dyadobacter sp. CY312]MCE7038865.1 NAD(P)/FAD-dependent oxidoreductase [Dyadobacter sp. CY312]
MENSDYDVVIVGGSYAGLSAGMALGRALRKVLIIDNGKPCNIQTPHSHNFLTQDGATPAAIAEIARAQVSAYPTVEMLTGSVLSVEGSNNDFVINTDLNKTFTAKKVLFATGVKDIMPDIPGLAACWGITVIHCPYCHGYEVRNQKTGILTNGEAALDFAQLINNWTKDLTIFTNGEATFSEETRNKIENLGVTINEKLISEIEHENGKLRQIAFPDGTTTVLSALYARLPFTQHTDIPEKLGCEMNEHGLIKTDEMKRTSVSGIYAAGDNTTMMRAVSGAVAAGGMAGAMINRDIIGGL